MKAKRTILLGARWKFPDFKGRFNNALSFILLLCQKVYQKSAWLYINRNILKAAAIDIFKDIFRVKNFHRHIIKYYHNIIIKPF